MKFNYRHNIHNIPLKVKIGCLSLFLVIIFIFIILFVGFFQVIAFLLESWIGIFILGLIIIYLIYKKFGSNFYSNNNKSDNSYTDAEYIELDDNEDNKN